MDISEYIYFGSVFAAALIFLFIGVLLLMQRSSGERSRTILAAMSLLSAANYVAMIIHFYLDPTFVSDSLIDVPFLLLGIFVTAIYFMYPIEVISPGWITPRRLLKMYMPIIGLWLFYQLTLWLGVEYPQYQTLSQMAGDIWSFQLIFRIALAMLMFLPALLLYYVPYTRQYNNTNRKWMRGYIVAITINLLAYLTVNVVNTFTACSIYVVISVLCSLYITYQELYVRLIRQQPASQPIVTSQTPRPRESELFERIEHYMNSNKAWQDPDLSVEKLVSVLYTNRTSLLKVLKLHGYNSYTYYVNGKRVAEFIEVIKKQGGFNYQQTFFDVGFRSKTTALRNFKEITGAIPSEYFLKQATKE